ncbi:hypothetical protein [Hyphococcus sp.]|uniref:hypothetical protein n=1 Tax=Hyphococcus sp. TaxID=2038636 RepID=UPI0035C6D895
MKKHQPETTPETNGADAESEDWCALSARIQKLAHRRSRSLLADHDDDAFDRGARSLRTLMSAAEVASRMRREEEKERETDDQAAGRHDFTEKDIEAAYRRVSETVDRLQREDAARDDVGGGSKDATHQDGSAAGSGAAGGGEALEGERA